MTWSIRSLFFGFIVGSFGMAWSLPPAEGALLDGLMGGVEESLGKRAEEKGEQLIIGNFYQAKRPDNHLEGSSPRRYSWETGQESLSLSNPRRSHDEIVRRD